MHGVEDNGASKLRSTRAGGNLNDDIMAKPAQRTIIVRLGGYNPNNTAPSSSVDSGGTRHAASNLNGFLVHYEIEVLYKSC